MATTQTARRGFRTAKLVLAVLLLCVAVLFLAFPRELREYRLYFTQDRPATVLSYEEMSEEWSEADVKARLRDVDFRCSTNAPGEYLDHRSCFGDVRSHNGIAALSLAFYFRDGKLNHMTVQVPWWKHRALWTLMRSAYGEPFASQALPSRGVRLAGWKLNSGHAMFLNRDPPINPLSWSMVLWSSQRACRAQPCFGRP